MLMTNLNWWQVLFVIIGMSATTTGIVFLGMVLFTHKFCDHDWDVHWLKPRTCRKCGRTEK